MEEDAVQLRREGPVRYITIVRLTVVLADEDLFNERFVHY